VNKIESKKEEAKDKGWLEFFKKGFEAVCKTIARRKS